MAQPSSGSYSFQPAFSDLLIEAYSRIQVRPTSFTAQHMRDAVMSANLLLTEWAVKDGPNLWEIALLSVPLIQGVASYSVPTNVVAILDYYVRQFEVGNPVNLAGVFTTVAASPTVTVLQPNHGMSPGQWMGITIPVSVGGVILYGFYQIQSVLSTNTYTILSNANLASAIPTSSVANGGVVPQFTSGPGSTAITVTLPNHGLFPQENFAVQIATLVGGTSLSGVYTVTSVIDANNFSIQAAQPAGAVAAVFENGGLAQLTNQLPNTDPQDRVVFPISRTEYSAQPDKATQAFPTTVWWDRLINSTITLWQVPDQNGPYVLYYYAMTQIQDVALPNGATLDVPYRFLEAFAAGLAFKLARKYPPPPPNSTQELAAEAAQAWSWASEQDVENVPWFISPGLSAYYRQ